MGLARKLPSTKFAPRKNPAPLDQAGMTVSQNFENGITLVMDVTKKLELTRAASNLKADPRPLSPATKSSSTKGNRCTGPSQHVMLNISYKYSSDGAKLLQDDRLNRMKSRVYPD
ncbi:hypothetical protein quinque_014313 [Culex quinquefasciatus]